MSLTPVPRKMLKMLSDCKAHSLDELHTLLDDKFNVTPKLQGVGHHLTKVRRFLRQFDLGILPVCVGDSTFYRLVRPAQKADLEKLNI